ncbi:hypothetical protein ACYVU7_11335, partial [Arenicellales bacterium IMCC56312]
HQTTGSALGLTKVAVMGFTEGDLLGIGGADIAKIGIAVHVGEDLIIGVAGGRIYGGDRRWGVFIAAAFR